MTNGQTDNADSKVASATENRNFLKDIQRMKDFGKECTRLQRKTAKVHDAEIKVVKKDACFLTLAFDIV